MFFFCTIVETKSKTSLVLKRMHFQCFLILFNAVFVEHSLLSIKSSFVLHLFRRALCASVISQDILILAWLNTSLKIFSYCRTLEFYCNSVIAPSFLLFMELFFLEWFFLSSTNNCLISWQQGYVDCQLFSNLSNIYLLFPCRSWPLTFWSTVWLDLRLPWFITGSSEPRGPEQSRLCQLCSWNWYGVTKCSPMWARVSHLSPELWKGECFNVTDLLGFPRNVSKNSNWFSCTKHPVWLICMLSLPDLFITVFYLGFSHLVHFFCRYYFPQLPVNWRLQLSNISHIGNPEREFKFCFSSFPQKASLHEKVSFMCSDIFSGEGSGE